MKNSIQIAYTVLLTALFCPIISTAQTDQDAIRLSTTQNFGSARSLSMANATTSVGNDYGSILSNPAGVAVYSGSQFTILGGPGIVQTNTTYNGNLQTSAQSNGIFGIDYVKHKELNDANWSSVVFSLGFHKANNTIQTINMVGTNANSSLVDVFMNEVQTNNISSENIANSASYQTNLAWNALLFDTLGSTTNYFSFVPNYGQNQLHAFTTNTQSSIFDFSIGSTYQKKLHIGASITSRSISSRSTFSHRENGINLADSTTLLESFRFYEQINSTGRATGLSAGFIYKASNTLRFGVSYKSPTIIRMRDSWSTFVESKFQGYDLYTTTPIDGNFDYSLISPQEVNAGLSVFFGKKGFVSVDYNFINTRATRYLSNNFYDFIAENQTIRDKYTNAHNIRVGTEFRFDPLRVRLGYASLSNTINSDYNNANNASIYSGGVGFKKNRFSFDVAYSVTVASEKYWMYNPAFVNAAGVTTMNNSLLFSVSFR